MVVTAAAGGALALVGAAAIGWPRQETTIQQVSPLAGGGIAAATLSGAPRGLSIEEIYRRSAPGVVRLTATTVVQSENPFDFLPSRETEQALGSGFVIDKSGHIITNYHVIQGAQKVQVNFSGDDQIKAKVVGTDPSTDVAVLQIDAHSRSLTPLPLGDSDGVEVGDSVVAIGNPFGLSRTATLGIVSALQRQIDAPNGATIKHAIQTDAAINHGNSGGPLINSRGQVIGVNAQITTGGTGGEGNVGIGFAIPVNTVKSVAAQIIQGGKATHAYLGVYGAAITPELVRLFNLPTDRGVMLEDVVTGSPADKAGLKPGTSPVVVEGDTYQLGGDIITKVGDTPVTSIEQLRDVIARMKPGDKLSLEVYRDGKKQSVGVKLGRQPPSPNG
jgi:putative serine protease PepD